MKITLKKEGVVKSCPLGFSWTVLFFGWLVPMVRLDFFWGFILLGGRLVLPWFWEGMEYEVFGLAFRFDLSIVLQLFMAFFYNALHIGLLLETGYMPQTDDDMQLLIQQKFLIEEEEDGDGYR